MYFLLKLVYSFVDYGKVDLFKFIEFVYIITFKENHDI